MVDRVDALEALVDAAGLDAGRRSRLGMELADVAITGADPVLATRFRIGEAAAVVLSGCAWLAAALHRQRGGKHQQVGVDVPEAAVSLLGFLFQRLEGGSMSSWVERQNITDFYATGDGRHVLVHGGFPHLQQGVLDLLDVRSQDAAPKDRVADAIAGWKALELEEAIARRGLCGAMVRSESEWRSHPQGQVLAGLGVVEVERFADAPPRPLPPGGGRPLEGLRVLDLTRVLAGPTCARTLASHGAEVLKVTAPELPSIPAFVVDTGHGKRSARLDLERPDDRAALRALVRDADVFSQGYRLGALERFGLTEDALHGLRPGIVCTSIDCYGHEGPWRERRGWEQLAQTVTGIAHENGEGGTPRLLPAAATDYTTGHLAALGTLVALLRRAEEGGSYRVRVSLAQTGMWIQSLGRCDGVGAGPPPDAIASATVASETPLGRLHHLGPIARMSETPPRWDSPSVPLGTHSAAWG